MSPLLPLENSLNFGAVTGVLTTQPSWHLWVGGCGDSWQFCFRIMSSERLCSGGGWRARGPFPSCSCLLRGGRALPGWSRAQGRSSSLAVAAGPRRFCSRANNLALPVFSAWGKMAQVEVLSLMSLPQRVYVFSVGTVSVKLCCRVTQRQGSRGILKALGLFSSGRNGQASCSRKGRLPGKGC